MLWEIGYLVTCTHSSDLTSDLASRKLNRPIPEPDKHGTVNTIHNGFENQGDG